MNKNTGIYKIVNITSNKVYIGSAIRLDHRKRQHFSLLKLNKHHSIHLQRAYNKNPKNFKFEILEFCNKNELLDKENFYLNYYCKSQEYINNLNKDFLKLSYNIIPIAIKGFGKKHSVETINILKLCHPLRKTILCYDEYGKFFKKFNSSSEVKNEIGLSRSAVIKLCQTKNYISKTYKYVFGFEEDNDFINFINNSKKPIKFQIHNKNKKLNDLQKRNIPFCTKIKCTNLKTKEITVFYSQKEACLYFNLQPCTINRCLKNKKVYRKKLLFEYYDIVQS
jgi:group I intron endonuclease